MKEKDSVSFSHENSLVDLFSRTISYLRLSLTDRCNLRCLYCITEDETTGKLSKLSHDDLLSYEEMLRIVRIAVDMGISKLRLTGGEPLFRRNVMHFIKQLAALDKLDDIRLTTNGVLLDKYGSQLIEAGVRKINISLDTLQRSRFKQITGKDYFQRVWQNIEQAIEMDFSSVKVNMVVMRGINDDEILDFARISLEKDVQVRFIEFMPVGSSTSWRSDTYMSMAEIMKRIETLAPLHALAANRLEGPARTFRLGENPPGTLGFISPLSHNFCDRCNRLRLTSEGKLRSCLLSDAELDVREVLRQGGSDELIGQTILNATRNKPKGHALGGQAQGESCYGRMSRIGG